MKFILSLFFILTTCVLEAQNSLKLVMDTKPVGSTIRISKYLGDMQIDLDSVRYRGEAEVNFTYDQRYTDGVYAVDINSLESFQFVLVNQEKITAHIYESGTGMAFKADGSKENDAFNIMLNLSEVYSKSMDTLGNTMNRLSAFAPRHDAIIDSLTGVFHNIADAYNHSLDLLVNLFPKSYTAQVLVPLDRIPLRTQQADWNKTFDNDAAFNHVHYFNKIDFSDERIITNPFLTNKILEYLYTYTERSEQGVKASIDKLLGFPKLNAKVQSYIIDLLIDFFTEKEAPEFIDHLNRNYLGSCELPLSKEALDKIAKMSKFKPGDPIPDIRLPSQTGHLITTSALTGQLNVLVFWSTECSHCLREIPKLKSIYEEMNGKMGVFAVSLDSSNTDWIKAVNDAKLKWFNVNEPLGWKSEYLSTFAVTSTPTFILLDDNLRWIGRAGSIDGLYEMVQQQLKE
jgi:thiol-disulfide isomerase/thioredoxin